LMALCRKDEYNRLVASATLRVGVDRSVDRQ